MKLLILEASHCLSLAMAREANRRSDTELTIEPALQTTPERLASLRPDALVIPPLSRPLSAEPAAVTAHAEAVEACMALCREAEIPWCGASPTSSTRTASTCPSTST